MTDSWERQGKITRKLVGEIGLNNTVGTAWTWINMYISVIKLEVGKTSELGRSTKALERGGFIEILRNGMMPSGREERGLCLWCAWDGGEHRPGN